MDSVKWMFAGDESVDKDVQWALDWRNANAIFADFLLTIQNIQKFDGWKDDPVRAQAIQSRKVLEDTCHMFDGVFW